MFLENHNKEKLRDQASHNRIQTNSDSLNILDIFVVNSAVETLKIYNNHKA